MTILNLQSPASSPRQQRHPLKVVAFGDSLVYGYGDPLNGGWAELLRRRWLGMENGHILYNLGVRGDTTAQVNQRLEQEYLLRGELRNHAPDCIILAVGVNDSPRLGKRDRKNMTAFDRFTLEMANLLDKAQSLCPVLFVGMIPVDESKMPFLDCFYFNHEDQFRYKEFTKSACQSRHIPYLDLFELWQSRGADWCSDRLCQDGLHPNPLGYRAIYEDLCQWQPLVQIDHTLSQFSFCLRQNENSKPLL